MTTTYPTAYAVHSRRFCHDGPVHVFDIGETEIWIGSRDEALSDPRWSLMISCAGDGPMFKPKTSVAASDAAKEMLPKELTEWPLPPCLMIDWPDQGIPTLPAKWWKRLVKHLPEVKGAVVFYCHGGHGRSGTAIAILAALAKKIKKGECPVEWLRASYCDEAVESEDQADYITYVTGVDVFTPIKEYAVPLPLPATSHAPAPGDSGVMDHVRVQPDTSVYDEGPSHVPVDRPWWKSGDGKGYGAGS